MTEHQERQRVVEIAHTWLRTPYHHKARVKSAGVDCLTLLAEVYTEAGLIESPAIPHYPQDWHCHRDEERYLEGLLQYTKEIAGPPLPGDIVVWKIGRCFSHGAIVIDWPRIIHAQAGSSVTLDDALSLQGLQFIGEPVEGQGKIRPKRFYSYWRK